MKIGADLKRSEIKRDFGWSQCFQHNEKEAQCTGHCGIQDNCKQTNQAQVKKDGGRVKNFEVIEHHSVFESI